MAVLRPLKLIIDNYPEGQTEYLDAPNNLENEALGMRKLPFGRELYIDFANSICFGGCGYSSSLTTQSYKGLWSSNSNVQMECVTPSMASSVGRPASCLNCRFEKKRFYAGSPAAVYGALRGIKSKQFLHQYCGVPFLLLGK